MLKYDLKTVSGLLADRKYPWADLTKPSMKPTLVSGFCPTAMVSQLNAPLVEMKLSPTSLNS